MDNESVVELPDDWLEIEDPEIDPAQIVEQIRSRIQRRREALGYPRDDFPTFGAAAYPGEPGGDFDADLYYHLRQVNEAYPQVGVESDLAPSPVAQMPLVGRLWARVRRQAHNLVLFYLNKLAGQQAAVNRHLVSVLNRLVVRMEAQEAELECLRQAVERLGETGDEVA
ncbi:MAG: hypothetical protein PVI59_13005 [Anaerolineae bacterium]|jgi:hypothetical protein